MKSSMTIELGITFDSNMNNSFTKGRKELLELSIKDLVDLRSVEIPQKPFLLSPNLREPMDFQTLRKHCSRIGGKFKTLVPEQGCTVATMLPNGPASSMLLLSVIYSGRILCPLNLAAGNLQLAYVLEHSESLLLFVHRWTSCRLS